MNDNEMTLRSANMLADLAGELQFVPPEQYDQDGFSELPKSTCRVCAAGFAMRLGISNSTLTRFIDILEDFDLTTRQSAYIFGIKSSVNMAGIILKLSRKSRTPKDAVTRIKVLLDHCGYDLVDN